MHTQGGDAADFESVYAPPRGLRTPEALRVLGDALDKDGVLAVNVLSKSVCVCVCVYTHILCLSVCIYVYIYICIYIHTHAHTCIYAS